MPLDDRIGLFDEWAASFDADMAANGDLFPFAGYEMVLRRIVDGVVRAKCRSVLDLGCGTGTLLGQIATALPAATLIGVDFSAEMLEHARRAVPGARFLQADIVGSAFWIDLTRVDAVVASYVLHELPDGQKIDLLERVRRDLLTPGGIIVVGDIGFETASIRDHARASEPAWDDDEHYFAADGLLPALKARGLHPSWEQVSWCGGVLTIVT